MILTENIQYFQFCGNVKTIARALKHIGIETCSVIQRRMRHMLEDLSRTLPPHHHAELRTQLELLERSIEGHYPFAEGRALPGSRILRIGWGGGCASRKREAKRRRHAT